MIIKGEENNKSQEQAQAAPTMKADTNSGGSAPQARNIMDIMRGFNTPSQLSEDARAYVHGLTTLIQGTNMGIKVVPISTEQLEANIFTDKTGNLGIAMVFGDAYQGMDDIPIAEKVGDIATRFNAIGGGGLLETIIVVKEDYTKMEKMATHIVNTFRVITDQTVGAVTLESLSGTDFLVSTNMNKVRAYVNSRSPHGIPARDDIGFVLFAQGKRAENQGWGKQEQRELTPILGVTGFTEFISTQGAFGSTGAQFLPVVRITEIISDIPNRNLVSLALVIAADAFIKQHIWLSAYQSFSKSEPNLGALITSNEGTHWYAENIQARNVMIGKHILPPYLAIDVTEGRARIAGLDKFIYNPKMVLDDAARFLGAHIENMINPVTKTWAEYLGSVHDGVSLKDGRCIDYLKLATSIKDPGKIAQFLHKEDDPKLRPMHIRDIGYANYMPVYKCMTSVLHSQFITAMSSIITQQKGNLSLIYEQQDKMTGFNPGLVDGSGNDFGNFNSVGGNVNSSWDFTRKGNNYYTGF